MSFLMNVIDANQIYQQPENEYHTVPEPDDDAVIAVLYTLHIVFSVLAIICFCVSMNMFNYNVRASIGWLFYAFIFTYLVFTFVSH